MSLDQDKFALLRLRYLFPSIHFITCLIAVAFPLVWTFVFALDLPISLIGLFFADGSGGAFWSLLLWYGSIGTLLWWYFCGRAAEFVVGKYRAATSRPSEQ